MAGGSSSARLQSQPAPVLMRDDLMDLDNPALPRPEPQLWGPAGLGLPFPQALQVPQNQVLDDCRPQTSASADTSQPLALDAATVQM